MLGTEGQTGAHDPIRSGVNLPKGQGIAERLRIVPPKMCKSVASLSEAVVLHVGAMRILAHRAQLGYKPIAGAIKHPHFTASCKEQEKTRFTMQLTQQHHHLYNIDSNILRPSVFIDVPSCDQGPSCS